MEDAILCSTKNETGKRGKGMKFKKSDLCRIVTGDGSNEFAMPMGVQAAEGRMRRLR